MRLQRTIKQVVVLKGKGIHNGEDVTLTIRSAPVDTGINFIRTDLKEKPAVEANVSNLSDYSGNLRRTSIEKDSIPVHMIEHLMAALSSLNIDNAEIEINNSELPILDGSALDYARELRKTDSLEQEKEKKELILKDAAWCADDGLLLIALPHKSFRVSYLLEYGDAGMAAQYADFTFNNAEEKKKLFVEKIAPARTFCMEREVKDILAKGLGKGASYKNTLVIKNGRPLQNELRSKNELARHKIMDLLGDISLLDAEIKAHIIGIRSGHSLNIKLLKKLKSLL
ncbi:MAG: UDP-3-O-acyl-N-acetylglucosamine deacetylase [Candidatus Omnitrophota bacterium]|nr:UDP-3-O-acyl-N-acetylglucosamine deacetylase [Candidatus Omnitrophota bacterium]